MARFKVAVIDADTDEVLAMSEEPIEDNLSYLIQEAQGLASEAWNIVEARAARARIDKAHRYGHIDDYPEGPVKGD